MPNILSNIPDQLPEEVFEDIVSANNIRIERILSHGHQSPDIGWYDQSEHEWVMVLEGKGVIEFDGGQVITLSKGDYLNISAGQKHRVVSTDQHEVTVWLAVFYQS